MGQELQAGIGTGPQAVGAQLLRRPLQETGEPVGLLEPRVPGVQAAQDDVPLGRVLQHQIELVRPVHHIDL